MGSESAQPAQTPEIDVCPYRGRESEDEPGGPTLLRAPAQDAAASG